MAHCLSTFDHLLDHSLTTFSSRLNHFLDDSGTTFVNHPVRRGRSRNSITIPHRGTSKTIPKTLKKLLRGREIEARNARQQPKHASKNDRKYEQKHKTKTYPIPQASRAFPIGKPSCDLDLAGPPVAVWPAVWHTIWLIVCRLSTTFWITFGRLLQAVWITFWTTLEPLL